MMDSDQPAEFILIATSWRDRAGVRHLRGDVVSPPEGDVDRLIRARAITTREAYEAAQAAAPLVVPPQATEPPIVVENSGTEGVTPPTIVAGGKPKKVAPVKDWEDYAVALHEASDGREGLSRPDAEALTKPDLIEMFG